jgi:hypothetical protein
MNNIINFYYGINVINIFENKGKYFFRYNNHNYYFIEYDRDEKDLKCIIEICFELRKRNIVSNELICNKFNSYITSFHNKLFVLLKENVPERVIGFNDILYFQNNTNNLVSNINCVRTDCLSLWKRKIDFYEGKLSIIGNKYKLINKTMDYYIGLGENAITYLVINKIQINNIVLSHRRINENMNSFDFYNPVNYILDNRARDLADYIKNLFFYKEMKEDVIFLLLYYVNLNREEYILFLSRLLYPTYYFDLIDRIMLFKEDEEILKNVISKTDDYILLLKRLFYYINYNIGINIPIIEWIIKK